MGEPGIVAIGNRDPFDGLEWTPHDQALLDAEVSTLQPIREEFMPALHGNAYDENGKGIYNFSNFVMVFGIVYGVRHGVNPDELDIFSQLYAAAREERKYDEVFGRLEQTYPALTKKLALIYKDRYKERSKHAPGSPEIQDFKQYGSYGYGAAAEIAKNIDPAYDLRFLHG